MSVHSATPNVSARPVPPGLECQINPLTWGYDFDPTDPAQVIDPPTINSYIAMCLESYRDTQEDELEPWTSVYKDAKNKIIAEQEVKEAKKIALEQKQHAKDKATTAPTVTPAAPAPAVTPAIEPTTEPAIDLTTKSTIEQKGPATSTNRTPLSDPSNTRGPAALLTTRTSDYVKQIGDFSKVYQDTEKKYKGAEYEVFTDKLKIFYENCTRLSIFQGDKVGYAIAFSLMLKDEAHYYDHRLLPLRRPDLPPLTLSMLPSQETNTKTRSTTWTASTKAVEAIEAVATTVVAIKALKAIPEEEMIGPAVAAKEIEATTGVVTEEEEAQQPVLTALTNAVFSEEPAATQFSTELRTIDGQHLIVALLKNATYHTFTSIDPFKPPPNIVPLEHFLLDRYSAYKFQRFILDSKAANLSTAKEQQVKALSKLLPLRINRGTADKNTIKFGGNTTRVISSVIVYYNNLDNMLVQGNKRIPINSYFGPLDLIIHDPRTNFAAAEFRGLAKMMSIDISKMPTEAYNSIISEEMQDLKVTKEQILQIAIKAVNDTAGLAGLVPTLLVFGAYPRMTHLDPPAPSTTTKAEAIKKAMSEVRRLQAVRQVADALNMRNGPSTIKTLALPLQSQEDDERPEEERPPVEEAPRRSSRNRRPPERYCTKAKELAQFLTISSNVDTFLTRKKQTDRELATKLRAESVITTPSEIFEDSQQREIEGLIAQSVFEFILYDPVEHARERIFSSRLVNELKGKKTATPFEKSRLVIQAFADERKEVILTQSPAIQRSSQRLITILAPALSLLGISLYLRDITQAYTQSDHLLNKLILARLPKEIVKFYSERTIMRIRRALYRIPKASTFWWSTYYTHHKEKLSTITSTYDPCLLICTKKSMFRLVRMQVDDTYYLADDRFAAKERSELKKAGLKAKDETKLTYTTDIRFNGCILKLQKDDTMLFTQKQQGQKLALVSDKLNYKQEYLEQRARGAYIASTCQPKALFALLIAAQHKDPSKDEMISNQGKRLKYVPIDLRLAKLFVFVDSSFANNKDLSSQLGYVIILRNETRTTEETFNVTSNVVHYSSTKSKRVTKSVLASEILGMVARIDIAIALNTTLDQITEQLSLPKILIVVATDSYSLYECLVKLGTTKEKRLMIDVIALRQSYERKEIAEIR
ncbi:polyprotein [Drepanopeziza brunnea f. sp. 'multigermtubi' MB_m1]|uniref:Polyprotein n=1 Tax=Marssonina brunnea f. sp. multigermtubi (strain MB_m1) TaxID=1072389 RepID=K1X6D7_MARBU|nr:polyprotein [Drepanopeziza brunnea f. sp. 'multigermtubi' MB_m1]EKD20667.1 polyprotein [Drepanopeziza brunnea f. sp. 'multigermtubi' MB_m1]